MSQWAVLVVKVPAQPSRHRVAVWRELRKIGALSLGQGPGGQAVAPSATGRSTEDASRFQALFTASRSEDWTEFPAGCGKFEAELAKGIRIAEFTLAELEEEERGACSAGGRRACCAGR
ncbi:Chromate resistance protein ChrB [Streptomyces sp. NPDC048419]|uniref:Chromate resistance protein ChrB n=1 Tax=Streptomyces sp. NPDC048419 TaxID=3365547 RepID=UPI00371FA1AE